MTEMEAGDSTPDKVKKQKHTPDTAGRFAVFLSTPDGSSTNDGTNKTNGTFHRSPEKRSKFFFYIFN